MKKVYLDNAATTALDDSVIEAMLPYMREHFGNPSSTHSHGREVKSVLEKARRTIADLLNASPSEIFFTSGGTESDNTAIRCSIAKNGITHAITSQLEHHAVLHTLHDLEDKGLKVSYANFDENGHIDLDHVEELLKANPNSLVSLMHGNNEIGNYTDIIRIAEMGSEYEAFFHSDTVQTVGHFGHDLKKLQLHAMIGAAHKFHGPKGVGFLFLRKGTELPSFVTGGGQERNMRGGTENVYGIIGMAKALEISLANAEEHLHHLKELKSYMLEGLRQISPSISFNGASADLGRSLPSTLNVCFPASEMGTMLLFNLDIKGISASGGSACSSGAATGSHVLSALGVESQNPSVRFSFSKYTTTEEIDYTLKVLSELIPSSTITS